MHRNSYIRSLTEDQVLCYILRSIFEGKNKDQIAERFDGDTKLIETWVNTLKQTNFVTTNYFDELVVTSDGKSYLEKFDSHR
jgi:hypothetical protein